MGPVEIIRISTAGSVDDGKSTLIGRLLYESGAVPEDQLEQLEARRLATGEADINLALLTDGLRSEREQMITIDVAYRYFNSASRRFVIADTPGHPQYTRNMVTGASTADVALLLLDAERGLTEQSKRHAFIASLARVPRVVVTVNKMDLVGYAEARYREIVAEFLQYAGRLELGELSFVPISALRGDNVVQRSAAMPWYEGATVLAQLEAARGNARRNPVDFRFPVQLAIRPDASFRGYAGRVVSGRIRVGEEVMAMSRGLTALVTAILRAGEPVDEAETGDQVTICLDREIDLSRGDMLVRPRNAPTASSSFEAVVCWMGDAPLDLSRRYVVCQGAAEVPGRVDEVVYVLNVETLHREIREEVALNDIARVSIRVSRPLFLDAYSQNRETGSVMLVDADTNLVAAAGVVTRVSDTRTSSARLQNRGLVVWMTGLSGAGKSTISDLVRGELASRGLPVVQLDGDALRAGLCADLGFTEADRDENLRRAAEMAKLLAGQGLVVLCSFISPLASQRERVRATIGEAFVEVFVSAPLEVAMARDPKGLYARALRGEIPNFTGVGAPYEPPTSPDLRLETGQLEAGECGLRLTEFVLGRLLA